MRDQNKELNNLYQAISSVNSVDEAKLFFEDIATPAELQALSDRWLALQELKKDKSYRTVSSETGISVTTVGRVSRCITAGSGGYDIIYNRLIEDQ